ncbi:MAG: DUF4350 domain-containing protein [Verrucomicrobiota bacterium]
MRGGVWRVVLVGWLLVVVGCDFGGKYEEREREIGYKGLARVDHFLAAKRLAEKQGMVAMTYAGLPKFPPPEGTVLMVPLASLQGDGLLSEIDDWIVEGGHLVAFAVMQEETSWGVYGEDGGALENFCYFFDFEYEWDFDQFDFGDDEEEDSDKEEVVREVDFAESYHLEGSYETEFETPLLIRDVEEEDGEWKAMHSYSYGEGLLTVLATAEPFTNREIGKAEHASLLWDLIGQGEEERVWFVYSARLSFFGMLWDAAPGAILALGGFVLVLVWWAWKGFGPRYHRVGNESAQLKEHLMASGYFFFRHRAEGLVLERMREGLRQRLARKVNVPFNEDVGVILGKAQEQELLSDEELGALQGEGGEKQLVRQLEILQTLDKRL